MRGALRPIACVALSCAALVASTALLAAIDRDLAKAVRTRFEGRTLRLRVDLRSASNAFEPNRISLDGVGYGRETAPVMFSRLEPVWVERVTSDGGTRLSLTLFRNQDEARQMRATSIPTPVIGNPAGANTMPSYARSGSTSVFLDLKAGKKDPEAQRIEIDELMGRLFYLSGEPARSDLEAFVLEHRSWSVTKLVSITGLTPDEVRALTTAPPPAAAPAVEPRQDRP